MREQPRLTEEQLRACLQEQYDLDPVSLDFLPLGRDYQAGVYRALNAQGTAYLIKATSRALYEPRYLVPRYLSDHGISAVVAPIPTTRDALWTSAGDWIVSVYPFVEGETSLTGMTDAQWMEVGSVFQRIHRERLPAVGLEGLRRETFDPTEYARWVRRFEADHIQGPSCASDAQRLLRSAWLAHQAMIHTVVTSLEQLAAVLQRHARPYVICHADLHARNLIRDRAGNVFVIDWDEVMLAPKERDFIFVREPHAAAFFRGYGSAEIDWSVLAYYLWERVVQDLMECAQHVWFRDDCGEAARLDAAASLHEILAADGGIIAAAYAAAAHLAI